jgi:hypothetical protein
MAIKDRTLRRRKCAESESESANKKLTSLAKVITGHWPICRRGTYHESARIPLLTIVQRPSNHCVSWNWIAGKKVSLSILPIDARLSKTSLINCSKNKVIECLQDCFGFVKTRLSKRSFQNLFEDILSI